jgi:hypothetical protein
LLRSGGVPFQSSRLRIEEYLSHSLKSHLAISAALQEEAQCVDAGVRPCSPSPPSNIIKTYISTLIISYRMFWLLGVIQRTSKRRKFLLGLIRVGFNASNVLGGQALWMSQKKNLLRKRRKALRTSHQHKANEVNAR